MKHRATRTALAALLSMAVVLPVAGASQGGTPVSQAAQKYIKSFRDGEDFTRPAQGLVHDHQASKEAVALLARELGTASGPVRENIVGLLEDVALQANAPDPAKFPVIRDNAIIQALLQQGFAKADPARDAAELALRNRSKPADLARHADQMMKILAGPDGSSVLYLVAKAKTVQAKDLVEKIAARPESRDSQGVKVAQAALGNTAVEDVFIAATREAEKTAPPAPPNRFYDVGQARDGQPLADRLQWLGFIGTPRSLLVACSYLRSPLKSYLPNHWERSVRKDALRAIGYNFPDERVLFTAESTEDYARAEKFCSAKLGAVFEGPTPDLPTDRAYPRTQ